MRKAKRKIKLRISMRLMKKRVRRKGFSENVKRCRFCSNKDRLKELDYKNSVFLESFLTERGKILPSRVSGNCFRHQRVLSKTVKLSRSVALVPYKASHQR